MHKDFSLHSGERQVGTTLDQIRNDHLARYCLAVDITNRDLAKQPSVILDMFCGNGYGTYVLADLFPNTLCVGIDASAEAIKEANNHYSRSNTLFFVKCFPFIIPSACADAVVSFESLEHVSEDHLMMNSLLGSLTDNGVAIISVPNENHHSISKNPHKFHYRHYTETDLQQLLPPEFIVVEKYGQDVYVFDQDGVNTLELLPPNAMTPVLNREGQVSISTIKRCV